MLLQDSRGVLVPFYDNQTALTLALEALLDDGRLRADMVRCIPLFLSTFPPIP